MHAVSILTTGLLAGLTVAAPAGGVRRRAETERIPAVSVLLKIAPNTATCAASFTQCETAQTVAPLLAQSCVDYNIKDSAQIAAIVSLALHESAEFKYKAPADPAQAAQLPLKGTSNMQSAEFNLAFANSLPKIASQVKAITNGATSASALSADQMKRLLTLLQNNDTNFATPAWFLATQCSPDIRDGLRDGTRASWVRYVSECVGVKEAKGNAEWDRREKYWADTIAVIRPSAAKV